MAGSPATEGQDRIAELLVSCAHSRLSGLQVDRIRAAVRSGVVWPDVLQSAIDHGVWPLLHTSLKTACPREVPEDVRHELADRFLENAQRNLHLARELGAIVALLAAHGIDSIPFKGPVLTQAAYGSLALRQFQDLDILVRVHQLARAKQLLMARGYRVPHAAARPEGSHECRLEHERTLVLIELHWRLTPRHWPFDLDLEILWQRSQPCTLAGQQMLQLPPPENLVVLCVHGAKHQWSRLDWVCCVAELLRAHPEVDWRRVQELARSSNSERVLYLGLALARELLDAVLPVSIVRAVAEDESIPPLVSEVRQRMFGRTGRELDPFAHAAFYFRMRERVQDKVPFFIHRARSLLAAAEENGKGVRLPRFCAFLSYLIVPVRLARKYGLLRILRHVLGR
ncbi:MAG: nucleotidyltransferase family protein [Planctomycetota bacterium]